MEQDCYVHKMTQIWVNKNQNHLLCLSNMFLYVRIFVYMHFLKSFHFCFNILIVG